MATHAVDGPPSTVDLQEALAMFVRLLGYMIVGRAEAFRLRRWGDTGMRAANVFAERVRTVRLEVGDDPAERESLAVLFEEIQFFVWRYRGVAPPGTPLSQFADRLTTRWGSGKSNGLSAEAVSDAETVVGSIEDLLGRVPRPLRWLLKAILEALKLTHGG